MFVGVLAEPVAVRESTAFPGVGLILLVVVVVGLVLYAARHR
jgi:hypothetical protein